MVMVNIRGDKIGETQEICHPNEAVRNTRTQQHCTTSLGKLGVHYLNICNEGHDSSGTET
jgi:hypothetical protein